MTRDYYVGVLELLSKRLDDDGFHEAADSVRITRSILTEGTTL